MAVGRETNIDLYVHVRCLGEYGRIRITEDSYVIWYSCERLVTVLKIIIYSTRLGEAGRNTRKCRGDEIYPRLTHNDIIKLKFEQHGVPHVRIYSAPSHHLLINLQRCIASISDDIWTSIRFFVRPSYGQTLANGHS